MNITFIKFEEILSTNTYALENIENLNDKSVIFADKQTHGKGRFHRIWQSENPQNLYFSIVLKPPDLLEKNLPLANLTQYMSVILCKILDSYDVTTKIKWPNDVLVSDKKIAGILAETSLKGNILKGVVLGVGVNLNSSKAEIDNINQPATSLNLESEKNVNKKKFLEDLIQMFFENYEEFLTSGFSLIKYDYIRKCFFLGQTIKITQIGETYSAVAQKINDDGTLHIKIGEKEKSISVGDIFCH